MIKSDRLQEIKTIEELNRILSEFIKNRFTGAHEIRILEAGCGNRWPLDLGALRYRLTGVDIDATGLELRKRNEKDLDVAIHGDLCTIELDENQFDVIYNSYVLEHVDGAERALQNFVRWLKPGGYMLLKFPDRNSVFGFLTRLLPFRLHVLYKKYIYKLPHAGEPGHGPFPTVYDPVVSRRGIHEFCVENGLEILHEYSTNFYLRKLGRFAGIVNAILQLVEIASLRKLKADYNNLVLIIRKPPSHGALNQDADPRRSAAVIETR